MLPRQLLWNFRGIVLDPTPSLWYTTRMNKNENIWIEQLELIGDILEEIKEIREAEESEYTEEDAIRDFCLDPKE